MIGCVAWREMQVDSNHCDAGVIPLEINHLIERPIQNNGIHPVTLGFVGVHFESLKLIIETFFHLHFLICFLFVLNVIMMGVIYKMLFVWFRVVHIDIKRVHAAICAPSIAVGGI
ncbi:hypothetical protein D3C86_1163420 [compost metagenome]